MSDSDEATLPQRHACLRLLTGLPGGTRQIRYTNMKDLRAAVEECYEDDIQDPFLVVVDVPPTILEDFDSEYLDKGPRITANLPERLLILKTLLNPGHESVASDLIFYIRVGVDIPANPRAAAPPLTDTDEQQEHSAAGPSSTRNQWASQTGWPILVAAESLARREDSSRSQTVASDHSIKNGRREADGRTAPIVVEEEVMATRKEDTTEVTGDMTFTFEEVIGRQRNEVNEGDIVITRADFREICQNAWAAQGFG
ncbi:uncharacterized protein ARB_03974 [Trichophyton benhamiae CBS 112371]|uniref:Uncharacterized protein n=1 Tax=Arthroderma benhamiae (strain ATCC MYA-4681 / CBS 112371) TaxID=663331 RepID=D4AKF2_ARTBC|nr:uncharacterized protein ARB_03974 [Trichophyton benhamiae CBS 112371]EFE36453.1 hypothetical protein ARB_03974 [Trichophyton benhamiae CBS 112371]